MVPPVTADVSFDTQAIQKGETRCSRRRAVTGIGRRVAQRARALDMVVVAHDPLVGPYDFAPSAAHELGCCKSVMRRLALMELMLGLPVQGG